jgi:hypothetical protein
VKAAPSQIDFLGIGAQRAGTTWLWRSLRAHPQIWTPPEKELHYFDRSPRYASANLLASDSLGARLFSRRPQDREFRRNCRGKLSSIIRQRDWAQLQWYCRYYFGRRNPEWYLSLFSGNSKRLRGEITPAYSMLERGDVARIRWLFPGLKILFLLRNPVDRAWSHLRLEWTEGRLRSIDDLAEVRALLEHPGLTLRNDYLRTLNIWESEFPARQLFIGFYDDIVTRPNVLLRDVFRFLEVDDSVAPAQTSAANPSKKREIPPELEDYLVSKYTPLLEYLAARFGGHARCWHDEARKQKHHIREF